MSKDNSLTKPSTNTSKEENLPTKEQLELREFLKLLSDLQTTGKITGQQFRENRELWLHQQPNDRDILVWRLKELLKTESKTPPPKNQDEIQKRPTRQRL